MDRNSMVSQSFQTFPETQPERHLDDARSAALDLFHVDGLL